MDDISETKTIIIIVVVNFSFVQHAMKIYLSWATGQWLSQALNVNYWDNLEDNNYCYFFILLPFGVNTWTITEQTCLDL